MVGTVNFISAAKNYFTGQIFLEWDGCRPTIEEVLLYVSKEYLVHEDLAITIEDPMTFKGLQNPGMVTVTPTTPIPVTP